MVTLVDRRPWDESADVGSKLWLVSQALRGDEESSKGNNPYSISSENNSLRSQAVTTAGKSDEDDVIPEDRFHLKLPKDVDQYTGVKMEGVPVELSDEMELPEDRFHRKDASSSYLIQQRDKAKQDKWANHEKYRDNSLFLFL